MRALEKLRALQDEEEPALLVELASAFLTRAARHLGLMRQQLVRGEASALAHHAHSLAGNSGMFGLMRLRECCKALETLALEKRLEEVEGLLAEAERAFEEARPLLLAALDPAS